VDLENICPIVDTVTGHRIHDKRGVLRDLARRAGRTRNVDEDVIFNALLKREELGSTGVGNGVAIPHVRLEQVKKPFGIMARLRHPIDFNAVDGRAVDLVCLVLLSKENDGAQLNALAGVARRLRIPEVLDDLRPRAESGGALQSHDRKNRSVFFIGNAGA
jgi:PTS system nitrogen regulatory IIA component